MRELRARKGLSLLELLFCMGLMSVVIGVTVWVLPVLSRQESQLERQARFSQVALAVLENLKNDLRSIDELTVHPDRLTIKRITGLSPNGEEETSTVGYRLTPQGIAEERETGQRLHSFLSGTKKPFRETFGGTFRLSGVTTVDRLMTGELEINLRLTGTGDSPQVPELGASLTISVTGRRLAASPASPVPLRRRVP